MNILLLSHHFHPFSKVASKRMVSLAAFLQKKGNNVTVVKANNAEYGDDIVFPVDDIFKTISLDKCYKSNVLRRILRNAQYKEAVSRLNLQLFDVAIISCGPFNYCRMAKYIKKKNPKIAIVLDFRDVLDGTHSFNNKRSLFDSIIQSLTYRADLSAEKEAIKTADICMTVSNQMNELYKNRYPRYTNIFHVVQNGYDDVQYEIGKDIILSQPSIIDSGINLGVFGKCLTYDTFLYGMFVEAIKELYSRGIKVCIIQFGYYEKTLETALIDAGLIGFYKYIPSQGYAVDIESLSRCNACVATNYAKFALGTKIFDYIWINKPIITINQNEDSEQVIVTKQFDNGFYCNNAASIVKTVEYIFQNNIMNLDNDSKKRNRYGRKYQFELVYKNMEELYGKHKSYSNN